MYTRLVALQAGLRGQSCCRSACIKCSVIHKAGWVVSGKEGDQEATPFPGQSSVEDCPQHGGRHQGCPGIWLGLGTGHMCPPTSKVAGRAQLISEAGGLAGFGSCGALPAP